MEPKFQSSFIPRSQISEAASAPFNRRGGQRDIVSFAAKMLFAITVILSGGIFLYKFYLNYRITKMGEDLENARAALSEDTVNELIRLNNRIVSTDEILSRHRVLSTIFDFLESNTPKSVRYTEFNYSTGNNGTTLTLKGEARGYATLAQAADIFNKNSYFKNPVFSDLNLDEKGNVVFSLITSIEGDILSYEKMVEKLSIAPKATSTNATGTGSTSSPQAKPAN